MTQTTEKVTPHVYFAGGPRDPLSDTKGFVWSATPDQIGKILESSSPPASYPMNIPPQEQAAKINKVNNLFEKELRSIEDTRLAQPHIVWAKRVMWVLAAAILPLAVAKLMLPLLIVGGLLGLTLVIYLHMSDTAIVEAQAEADRRKNERLKPAASERRLPAHKPDVVASPAKEKKEPTSWADYSRAFNEMVAQMLLFGQSPRIF